MDDTSQPLPVPLPLPDQSSPSSSERLRWFELFLVLSLSFGNALYASFYLLKNGPVSNHGLTNLHSTYGLLHEIWCLLLLAYILSRRRLTFKNLGLRWSLRDIGMGLLVGVLFYVVYAFSAALIVATLKASGAPATKLASARDFLGRPSLMAIPYTLVNPFFEELIVRAYLMTEVLELTGSAFLAVLVSTLLQSAYHLYYGWIVAAAMGASFLVFSIFFLRTRKATSLVAAHELVDFVGIARLFVK